MIKEGSGGWKSLRRKSVGLFKDRKFGKSDKVSRRSTDRHFSKVKRANDPTSTLFNQGAFVRHISKRNVKTKGIGMKESLHSMLEGRTGMRNADRTNKFMHPKLKGTKVSKLFKRKFQDKKASIRTDRGLAKKIIAQNSSTEHEGDLVEGSRGEKKLARALKTKKAKTVGADMPGLHAKLAYKRKTKKVNKGLQTALMKDPWYTAG